MPVLSLVKHLNRDTIELLESMLVLANNNETRDIMLAYRAADGSIRVGLTGLYKTDGMKALEAAMQVSMHLTRHEERARGRP